MQSTRANPVRTLYVTDLDGTLMRDDKTVSKESVGVFNQLISQGVCITYATARSLQSASAIVKDIHFEIPVILLNGTILANPQTNEELEISIFAEAELDAIRKLVHETAAPCISTNYLNGNGQKTYLAGRTNEGFQEYLKMHTNDKRMRIAHAEEDLFAGRVCFFTFIAAKEELQTLYERTKNIETINCIFQEDKYRPEYWLELAPQNATKAKAAQRVKELCNCEKIVVFGDSLNDIPLFLGADECYAVENAMDELKEIATGIIGSNNSDGVARWLAAHAGDTAICEKLWYTGDGGL